MKSIWYRTGRSLLAGELVGLSELNSVISADPLFQHPAVSPTMSNTAIFMYDAAKVAAGINLGGVLSAGSNWVTDGRLIYTGKMGDYFQFVTPPNCVYILVYVLGVVTSGMGLTSGDTGLASNTVRNGGIANISVDGVPVATVDSFNGIGTWSASYPTAKARTVRVTQSGAFNVSVHPVSAVRQTIGTSVSPVVTLDPTHGTLAASWRIKASSTSAYSIYNTPVGGIEASIAANVAVGVPYTVSGITITVSGPLTVVDEATFLTDQVMLGALEVGVSPSYGLTSGGFSSDVIDSAVYDNTGQLVDDGSNTLWSILRWTHNYLPTSIVLEVSDTILMVGGFNTLVHTAAYSITTLSPYEFTLKNGTLQGIVGLQSSPRGRYAVWSINFPTGTVNIPYFRDAIIYWMNPDNDPNFIDTIAIGKLGERLFDSNALALFAAFKVMITDWQVAKDDLINSYTVQNAVDQQLAAYGAAQGILQYSGEPPEAYQTRVGSSYASKSKGSSISYICAQAAQLVNGSPQVISAPTYTGQYATVSGGGVTVAQKAGRGYTVSLPPPQMAPNPSYPGLIGLSLADSQKLLTDYITNKLRPVGSLITLYF